MGDVMAYEEFANLCYEEETTAWGTDEATTRLPILGVVRNWTVRKDHHVEPYYSGATAKPTGFVEGGHDITTSFEFNVQDDNPTNSLLAFAFGSAPNGTTGLVTNRFDLADRDLRPFTAQAGIDWSQTDEWWRTRGNKVRRCELHFDFRAHLLTARFENVSRHFDKQATPFVAVPAVSTLAPFAPKAHGTITYANPSIANAYLTNMRVVLENEIVADGAIRSGSSSDRDIEIAAPVGTQVFVEVEHYRSLDDFLDQHDAARDTAGAELDITAVLSKNAAAEYVSLSLTNSQIVEPYEISWRSEKGIMSERLRFQASDWTLDVKS